jgi:nitrite reductase/ring-hydroxylating ferredoxin subunit
MSEPLTGTAWVRVPMPTIGEDQVTTVVAGGRAVCLVHHAGGEWTALDNRCPHQGGPLGDGQLDDGYLICPWHAYEYDPTPGRRRPGSATPPCPLPCAEPARCGRSRSHWWCRGCR